MFHKLIGVNPKPDLVIEGIFEDGTKKYCSIRQFFNKWDALKSLEERDLFNKMKLSPGGFMVIWNDLLDIDSSTIWEYGVDALNLQEKDGFLKESELKSNIR